MIIQPFVFVFSSFDNLLHYDYGKLLLFHCNFPIFLCRFQGGVYQNGKGKIQKNVDLLKNFVYNCIMDKFDG